MSTGVSTAARGCGGSRTQGGIYATCGLSSVGMPLDFFLIDPPQPVPDDLPVPAIGVTHFTKGGITYVVDKVGRDSYPNVADFYEEVKRMGLSRRLPKTFPFHLLTRDSRILLVHDRAYIENFADYYDMTYHRCPKRLSQHKPTDDYAEGDDNSAPSEMCAGLWWQDIDPTQTELTTPRVVQVEMPSFSYTAQRRPVGVAAVYKPAFFLSLPIQNLNVVKAEDGSHADSEDRARMSQLPIDIMES